MCYPHQHGQAEQGGPHEGQCNRGHAHINQAFAKALIADRLHDDKFRCLERSDFSYKTQDNQDAATVGRHCPHFDVFEQIS